MNPADWEVRYRGLTDDELAQLAMESQQLSPEANISLGREISRRGINHKELDSRRADSKPDPKARTQWDREKTYSLFPSLQRMGETLSAWQKYRRQTGKWPFLSITFSFVHLLADLTALAFLVWYGAQHRWSKGRFILVVMPCYSSMSWCQTG